MTGIIEIYIDHARETRLVGAKEQKGLPVGLFEDGGQHRQRSIAEIPLDLMSGPVQSQFQFKLIRGFPGQLNLDASQLPFYSS